MVDRPEQVVGLRRASQQLCTVVGRTGRDTQAADMERVIEHTTVVNIIVVFFLEGLFLGQ